MATRSLLHLPRRAALAGGLATLLGAGPAGAAVKVVRGSSTGEPAGSTTTTMQGGVRVVRPGAEPGPTAEAAAPTPLPPGELSGTIRERLAGAPTRRLVLDHAHTGEKLSVTYWRDGALDGEAETAIRWFLRDWRRAKPSPLSVDLLDILWSVQSSLGGGGDPPALRILSGYRTRQTNEELRSAGVTGVAQDSYHLRGMAADFHCPSKGWPALAENCSAIAPGGIGTYRRSGFMHLDAGPSRRWTG